MLRLKGIMLVGLAALFAPAVFALDLQNAPAPNPAVPGTLNYIEGSTQLNGETVGQNAVGSATLTPGQTLTTANGHVEVLLTPGVFFRLAQNSAAQMVSPNLTDTAVAIEHGRAEVEVDQLFKENNIHIVVNNLPVQLVKTGLYEFDADRGTAMVFSGEAAVPKGDGHWTLIKSGHVLNVAGGANDKPVKFDVDLAKQSGLYRWSSLRSDYLAEANQQMAADYAPGYAAGWYWDPWMFDYTFLGPYPFYSPFGWGFYPFGFGGGFYGGHYPHHGYGPGSINHFSGGQIRGGGVGGFHGGGGFGGGMHGGGGHGR